MPVPTNIQQSRQAMRSWPNPFHSITSVMQLADAIALKATICMEVKPCPAIVLTKSPIKPHSAAAPIIYRYARVLKAAAPACVPKRREI